MNTYSHNTQVSFINALIISEYGQMAVSVRKNRESGVVCRRAALPDGAAGASHI